MLGHLNWDLCELVQTFIHLYMYEIYMYHVRNIEI